MARPYNNNEAKELIKRFDSTLKKLKNAKEVDQHYVVEIKNATNEMVSTEVYKLLSEVSIEEINRDKRGIKIGLLKSYGYNTVADVCNSSASRIASIKGISETSASDIKYIAKSIETNLLSTVKVKISADKKTVASTKTVSAISRYLHARDYIDECSNLYDNYSSSERNAVNDLTKVNNFLKWLFASAVQKDAAGTAFEYIKKIDEDNLDGRTTLLLDKLNQVEQASVSQAWEEFVQESIKFINVIEKINPGILGNDNTKFGLPEELVQSIENQAFFPDGLLCDLRRYQEWGVKYILHQERVLLGDEMGLGKTIQAIATMVSLTNTGETHFVVVCPASVLTNWCREIERFSKLLVTKVHGQGRSKAIEQWLLKGGVAVTTYETTQFFKLKDNYKFGLLVVDEAHYIKNENAQRSKNVRNLCLYAERLLFMTGTALENNVEEMISLIDILNPDVSRKISNMTFITSAPSFRRETSPVYYRRKREDVLTELPDKTEEREWCSLLKEEEKIYEEAILAKKYADARRVSWNVDDLSNSSKARRMKELIEEAEEEGRKIIVFSFFLDTISKIKTFLGDRCLTPINGSVSPEKRQSIIDEFDKSPAGTVLVSQIQSGGTGLNIQTASVVIICEPQFKPSIENQAISRAYRMGQSRNVLVYRLLAENTVDEHLTEILQNKQTVFDAFADTSVAAENTKEIDDKTFGNIIEEEIDRIKAKRNIQ